MGFTLNISIPALTVLAQGLLSFFSPCVLPLLPVYFGFLSGGATAEEKPNRAKTLVNTVCFVLGISFAFFLLAANFDQIAEIAAIEHRKFLSVEQDNNTIQ